MDLFFKEDGSSVTHTCCVTLWRARLALTVNSTQKLARQTTAIDHIWRAMMMSVRPPHLPLASIICDE
jgi:hypothetical protein